MVTGFHTWTKNSPFALADHVINFLQTQKQFVFENFSWDELRKHIKIR